MRSKIINNFVQGKSPDQSKCEDRIVITDNYCCVIDGATTKSQKSIYEKASGILAVEILEQAVIAADRELNASDFANFVTEFVAQFYHEKGIYDSVKANAQKRISAVMAVYSVCHEEVWCIGDCQCMIDEEWHFKENLVDEINSKTRSLILELELLKGKTIEELQKEDVGRGFILPILQQQHLFQNAQYENPLSFQVVDGFPIDIEKVRIYDVQENKTLVLASDGYPVLFPTLRESEEYLAYILKHDPLCHQLFKSTKGLTAGNLSFDDRAYLKIEKS